MPKGVFNNPTLRIERLRGANLGKHLSIETRRKIGDVQRGKRLSEKTKVKMKLAHLGKKYKMMSEKGRKNISLSHKGTKLSEITRKKISDALSHRVYTEEMRKNKSEASKGEKCYNWKGGITPVNKKARNSPEFKLWREAVYKRDDYTCQKYGIKGGGLHPHHIKNFTEYPELRFDPNNGITLSEKAHREFHKKYGKQHNTREQLNEFLRIN